MGKDHSYVIEVISSVVKIHEVIDLMFEDKDGNILMSDEVDELSPWEIEERGIHVYDSIDYPSSRRRRRKVII